ncbi:hypothetical protein C8Q73DRAFT_304495 [Cubamyces lactineus]|nr:hypothetical protein C8Q73DRAFT_304495 [Cubamyces lactineus]
MSTPLRVRFTCSFPDSSKLPSLSLMPRDRFSNHSPEHNHRPSGLHLRLLPIRSRPLAFATSMASHMTPFPFVQPLLPSPLNFLCSLLVWCATTAPISPAYTLMPRPRFFRGLSVLLCFSLFSLLEASVVQTWPTIPDGLPNQGTPLFMWGSRSRANAILPSGDAYALSSRLSD